MLTSKGMTGIRKSRPAYSNRHRIRKRPKKREVRERGTLFIGAGVPVYEGMIIGVANRGEDIVVNACRKKQLTNTRASGSDDALRLVPPRQMSLEQCLEFLADDELLEVTPKSLRMRKAILNHEQRMKSLKGKK